jgi:hypothetical protein
MSLRKDVKEINSSTPGGSKAGDKKADWSELRGLLIIIVEHEFPGYAKSWVDGKYLLPKNGINLIHNHMCKIVPWWPAEYERQAEKPFNKNATYNRIHKCHWEPRKSVDSSGYRGGVRTVASWEHPDQNEMLKRCRGTIEKIVSTYLNDGTSISKEDWYAAMATCHEKLAA